MSGFICGIRVYPLHPIVIFHCFENNSNGQIGWQYAYAGNKSNRSNTKGYFYAIPDSFGANMKSYSILQYERQQHRTITSLSPQSNIVLAERDWCTEFTSVSVGSSPRSYSFTSVTVVETGARSFTPLQNLRRDHRSFV